MAVTSNTLMRRISTRTVFPNIHSMLSSAISFTQGDLLCLDTATHLVRRLAAEADSATLLGIAPVTITSGKYPPAYLSDVDASVGTPAVPGPEYGSTYSLLLKAGDAITPGQKVYANAANLNNGVTVTVGTALIGVYQGAALTAATGGTSIEVLVGQNYQPGV